MKDKVKKIIKNRPSLKKLRSRKQRPEQTLEQAVQGLPRITNETVAEHREEVLSSARKYIYPLQHSPRRVILISVSLFIVVVVAFFTYCMLALYKFQSSSTFLYRVTQVLPFPVAKAGSRYIAYENYLFELRHYMHYYQTQQRVDFNSESGKQQLAEFRQRAMDRVIDYAYVKQLAKDKNISVTDRELEDAIRLVRNQNRLGSNDRVFEDVLREFWGWSVNDFKRELRQQMLAQKVVTTLDTATHDRAKAALQRIQGGQDFAAIAVEVSDDQASKPNGGAYGFVINQSDRNLAPQVIDVLFKMNIGEVKGPISTGNTLELLKLTQRDGDKLQASHIAFNFKPIGTYIDPLRQKDKPKAFIK